jgi:NitT/TauT family transport system substrate-binding protein
MLFTKTAVDKKRNEIKEFYEAYDKAVEYISSHEAKEFMPAIIKTAGLPETALEVTLPQYEKYALPEKEQVLNAMNWLLDKGLLKNEYQYDELVKDINED